MYNYTGLNNIRGKYAISRRPNLDIKTWVSYSSLGIVYQIPNHLRPYYHEIEYGNKNQFFFRLGIPARNC